MAGELDANLLKNLDERLKSMDNTLGGLQKSIEGVGSAMSIAFGSAAQKMVSDVQQAFRGAQLVDMLGVDQARLNIDKLEKDIIRLKGNLKTHTDGSVVWNPKSGNWKYQRGEADSLKDEKATRDALNESIQKLNYSRMTESQLAIKYGQTSAKIAEEEERRLLNLIKMRNQYKESIASLMADTRVSMKRNNGEMTPFDQKNIELARERAKVVSEIERQLTQIAQQTEEQRKSALIKGNTQLENEELRHQERMNAIRRQEYKGIEGQQSINPVWNDMMARANEREQSIAKATEGYIKKQQKLDELYAKLDQQNAKLQSQREKGVSENSQKKTQNEIAKTEAAIKRAENAQQTFIATLLSTDKGRVALAALRNELGLVEEEEKKVSSVFDRVIADINARAQKSGEEFAKKIANAKGVASEAKAGASEAASIYKSYIDKLNSLRQSFTPPLTSFGVQNYIDKLQQIPIYTFGQPNAIQQLHALENTQGVVYERLLEPLRRYKEALQQIEELKERSARNTAQYAAQQSAVEGVTRRYQENEQAIQRLKDRWEELNVKKQAGLINEKDFNKNTQKILDEYDKLINKRKEFEIGDLGDMAVERQKKLAQIQRENTRARVQDEIDAEKRIAAERARRARGLASVDPNMNAAVNKQIQYQRQLNALRKEYNTLNEKQNKTREDNAILEQTKQKIKDIINLSRQLNNEQKGSHNLAKQITDYDRIKQKIREANAATREHEDSIKKMIGTAKRLVPAFGFAFSVQGLVNFGKKLIETRGEFEMQFVAMKQIIGDVDAATKIWNQTMQQALQSPFRAMQLVDYTKKLAAYRIETDKLFDTTKRLADVSAGLGVDMGRLILAYGQVKSANFLRASEVRQFTEAGVNIYGELSKYLSEINGRLISTAEVAEMVQKRLVSFADIEEIFKRMTDEGGVFFNMQEVQADTVKGQINKLHDAYDQMLNTIGQANQGTIRDLVEALNDLVKNWRSVKNFFELNVYMMLPMIGLMKLMKTETYKNVAANTTFVGSMKHLGNAFKYFWISAKPSDWKYLITSIRGIKPAATAGAAGMRILDFSTKATVASLELLKGALRTFAPFLLMEGLIFIYNKATEVSRAKKQLEEDLTNIRVENSTQTNNEIRNFDKLIKKFNELNQGSVERKDVIDKLNSQYGKYLGFQVKETTTLKELADAQDRVNKGLWENARIRAEEAQAQRIEQEFLSKEQELFKTDAITGDTKLAFRNLEGERKGLFTFLSSSEAKGFAEYVKTQMPAVTDEVLENADELREATKKWIESYFGVNNVSLTDTKYTGKLLELMNLYADKEKRIRDERKELSQEFSAMSIEDQRTLSQLDADISKALSDLTKAKSGDVVEIPTLKLDIKIPTDLGDKNSVFETIKEEINKRKDDFVIKLKFKAGFITKKQKEDLEKQAKSTGDLFVDSVNKEISDNILRDAGINKSLEDFKNDIVYNQDEIKDWSQANHILEVINSTLVKSSDIVNGLSSYTKILAGNLESGRTAIDEAVRAQELLVNGTDEEIAAAQAVVDKARERYRWLLRISKLLGVATKAEDEIDKETGYDLSVGEFRKQKAQEAFLEKFGKVNNTYGKQLKSIGVTENLKAVADAYHKQDEELQALIKNQETMKKNAKNLDKAQKDAINTNIANLKEEQKMAEFLANYFGYVAKNTKKGNTESVSKMVSLLKDMNTEYEKLTKSAYGYAKSEKEVRRSFENSFNEIYKKLGAQKVNGKYPTIIDFNETDFTTKTGLVAAYEKVLKYVKENVAKYNKDAVADLEKRISEMNVEIGIDVQVRIREDFAKEMEEAFGNYELTLDLQKLNLPTDLMEDMFDIESVDMTTLRQKITDFYNNLRNEGVSVEIADYDSLIKQFGDVNQSENERIETISKLNDKYGEYIGFIVSETTSLEELAAIQGKVKTKLLESGGDVDRTDMEKIEQYVKKLDDMERKAQLDRIKEYAKYLEYELSERAKISMEYAKKIADVQTERSILADKREKIIAGLTKEMNEKLAKQDWEDFKGSEVYVQMMEDLEKHGTEALTSMRKELELIRTNAKNLSPRALKEVINAIEKIRDIELNRMDPFKGLKASIADVKESLAKVGVSSKGELYAEAEANERNLVLTQRRKQEVDRVVAAQNRAVEIQKELNNLMEHKEVSSIASNTVTSIDEKIDAYQKLLEQYENDAKNLTDEQKALIKERLDLAKEMGRLTTEESLKNVTDARKSEIYARRQEIENRVQEINKLFDGNTIGENIAKGIIDAIKRAISLTGELSGISEKDKNDTGAKERQQQLSEEEKRLQSLQNEYNKAVQSIDNYNKQVQRMVTLVGEWIGKVQTLWSDLTNLTGAYEGELGKWMGRWGKVADVALQQIGNLTKAFGEFRNSMAEYQKSATKKQIGNAIEEIDNTIEERNTLSENENTNAVNRNSSARAKNTLDVDENTASINANTKAKIENANADKIKYNNRKEESDIIPEVSGGNVGENINNVVSDSGVTGNTEAINANTAAKIENATASQLAATGNEAVGTSAAYAEPAVVSFGATLTAVMGWVGLIAAALSALTAIITAVAQAHDDSIEEDIEREQKKIDALQRAYQRLENQINRTWTSFTYMETYEKQVENIKRQIESLEKQIDLEEDKKNSDESKIVSYKNAIEDAYDELEELERKQIEVFGGIGVDNYRSAAEGFVEAWKSAFLETGDGLQGLQDHFDEFLQEWFVKQATMRIAGKMLEPMFTQIDAAVDKYGDNNVAAMLSEIRAIQDRASDVFPALSAALEELAGNFDIQGEGSLSGLAAGIQGMTEEQANILEAYWNSVRMYVANIDSNVARIASMLGAGGVNTNPMLGKLDSIINNTSYIKKIYDMLEPLQTNNGNGRGFRTYNS